MIGNGASYASLLNHIFAINSCLALYDLDFRVFEHHKVKMILRSMQINRAITISQRVIIDINMLQQIVQVCDFMYMGQIFKSIYLTAYFTFLRISNFGPHKMADFDHTRHLARGDVFFCFPGAKILVKWTKTIQSRDSVKFVKIPSVGLSPLYPVTALQNVLKLCPGQGKAPLFQVKVNKVWNPVTDSKIRHHFGLVLARLGCSIKDVTFHSFRRSGASFAFNSNVGIQEIQDYGTWTSDCVWRYLTQSPDGGTEVALTFTRALFQSSTPT